MTNGHLLDIFLHKMVRFKNEIFVWEITFIQNTENGIFIRLESVESDRAPLWGKYIDKLELIE